MEEIVGSFVCAVAEVVMDFREFENQMFSF